MLRLKKGLLFAVCCTVAFGFPLRIVAQEIPRASSAVVQDAASEAPTVASGVAASAALPDSPGTKRAQSQDASSQRSGSSQTASTPFQQSAVTTQDQKPDRPVGTAAAEAPKVSGITAAEPAGVAIAPAKQRRVRTMVLKVGAIVGAGAALGVIIALSEATPSKPPGAR